MRRGANTEWLLAQGASVVAVDITSRMIELTRERVGEEAELHPRAVHAPPVRRLEAFGLPNYYATGPVEDIWPSDGVLHRFHRRTMEDLLEGLMGAGFLLERNLEALPPDAVLAAFPDADVPPDPFFLFLRAVPAPRPSGR